MWNFLWTIILNFITTKLIENESLNFEIRVLRFEFGDSSFSFECLTIGEVQVHGQPMLGAITKNEKSFEKFFHKKRTTD